MDFSEMLARAEKYTCIEEPYEVHSRPSQWSKNNPQPAGPDQRKKTKEEGGREPDLSCDVGELPLGANATRVHPKTSRMSHPQRDLTNILL